MFGKPKAKGLDVMIAVGKPKSKSDLSEPGSLDAPMKAKHEEAEAPEYEANEEYGAKLISDLEEAGAEHGLDAETTHKVAASFFRAMADCLSGSGDEEEVEHDAGGMDLEGEGEEE